MQVPEKAVRLARLIADHGGRLLIVGGWVRDALLGRESPDLDLEIFGIPPADLESLLVQHYRLDRTGQAFGVLKIHGEGIDVSVPRREAKTAPGHRGFLVDADPGMSFDEAARRRDFTINAMGCDPLTGELLDPCGGRRDLSDHRLRHTSGQFTEDPLRVLRGMQLCARFELEPVADTVDLCRTMTTEGIAPERVFPEWRKLIIQGERPSLGLEFLRRTRWLRYYPELEALIGVPQDPRWHPEGDVWTHLLHAMDAFAADRLGDPGEDLVVGLAVLCHDLGKTATTTIEGDRVRSRGHGEAGEEPARALLERMGAPASLAPQILPLVREHVHPVALFNAGSSDAAVRRLAHRAGRLDRLARVVRADQLGRPPLADRRVPAVEWLLERARNLSIAEAPPQPLVLGRHLVAEGLRPGPDFGPLLDACYEAQLEGVFGDEAGGIAYLRKLLAGNGKG